MRVWKWLGWDTKEARTQRVLDNNKHGTERNRETNYQTTIRWAVVCIAAVFIAYFIRGY